MSKKVKKKTSINKKTKKPSTTNVKSSSKKKSSKKGKKKTGGGPFYYANPKNVSAEIKGYGFEVKPMRNLIFYGIYMAVMIVLGLLFGLGIIPIVILCAAGFLFVPYVITVTYRNSYQQQRFSEATQYIEQMLYSFRNNRKVVSSLKDVETIFSPGTMKSCIREAQFKILNSNDESVEEALKIIERAYPCEKIKKIHSFMIKVEDLGGDFSESIDLLLQDRSLWVDRQLALQKDRSQRKTNVIASIVISLLLCLFVQRYCLGDIVDLAGNLVVQVGTTVCILADLIIYVLTEKAVCVDYLKTKSDLTPSQVKEKYEKVINYNPKKEFPKSLLWTIIPVGLVLAGLIFDVKMIIVAGAVMSPITLFQHRIAYSLNKKAIKKEIELKFPRWLMEIALRLQTDNVQVSIANSISTAPIVLRPELYKMQIALEENPTSIDPYLNFMKDFDSPEIQSSMKMLYSISAGQGGDSKVQIADIIRRNNAMLDKVERQANEDSLVKLMSLIMAPQISASLKLIIDMIVFFVVFMAETTAK